MSELNRMTFRASLPKTIEMDGSCHSVYIRFKTAKIQKTVSSQGHGPVVAVDIDGKGEVVGIELVGVRQISIKAIRHYLPDRLKDIDLEQARFVQSSACQRQAVMA